MSSRPNEAVKSCFGIGPNMRILTADTAKDIGSFVKERLCEFDEDRGNKPSDSLITEIIDVLLSKRATACMSCSYYLSFSMLTY
jgi:hypothetical protein